jgi:hypothetical protein
VQEISLSKEVSCLLNVMLEWFCSGTGTCSATASSYLSVKVYALHTTFRNAFQNIANLAAASDPSRSPRISIVSISEPPGHQARWNQHEALSKWLVFKWPGPAVTALQLSSIGRRTSGTCANLKRPQCVKPHGVI